MILRLLVHECGCLLYWPDQPDFAKNKHIYKYIYTYTQIKTSHCELLLRELRYARYEYHIAITYWSCGPSQAVRAAWTGLTLYNLQMLYKHTNTSCLMHRICWWRYFRDTSPPISPLYWYSWWSLCSFPFFWQIHGFIDHSNTPNAPLTQACINTIHTLIRRINMDCPGENDRSAVNLIKDINLKYLYSMCLHNYTLWVKHPISDWFRCVTVPVTAQIH